MAGMIFTDSLPTGLHIFGEKSEVSSRVRQAFIDAGLQLSAQVVDTPTMSSVRQNGPRDVEILVGSRPIVLTRP